jgi:hypothetical protein
MSTDDQNPQQATIQDIFRVVTALRAENAARFDAVENMVAAANAKLDGHSAGLAYLRAKSDEHSVLLDAHSGELEAIRQVVDGLPTMGSVTSLEDGQISIKRDTEAVRKEVRQIAAEQRKFASRLDRAGIPAE